MSWSEVILIIVFLGLSSVACYAWWDIRLRTGYTKRLEGLLTSFHERNHQRRIHTFPERHRWVPLILSSGVLVLLILFADVPLPFSLAVCLLTGVVSYLIEGQFVKRQLEVIEQQLADSIDLIVGLLQSGMALPKSLEMAMHETGEPFKPFLKDIVGRIRLGDDPQTVIQQLAHQIPLETFQLFSSILSVQWWSGGSVANTLLNVSTVVRSRMELDRRIRTQSVESQLSVLSILLITYGLAFLMWHVNPEAMETFLSTSMGAYLGSMAIVAQTIGIVWITKLSEIKF
ncbi:MAG: type II secretion system F family protein [Nitrospirales bacterium]